MRDGRVSWRYDGCSVMLKSLRDGLLRWYVRTPEHPMKYRIVQWLGRHVFPDAGVRAPAYPRLDLLLHPRDWIEYLLLRGDRYEPRTLDFLAANLAPGQAVLLAGVNFGQHVAVAARAVGPTGLVIGVEPQPRALLRAAANLQHNGLSAQVRLVGAALGEREDLLPMAWSSPHHPGVASLLDEGDGLTVPIVRASRLIGALARRRLRLLLLDVQGYELKALAGLDPPDYPDVVVVEMERVLLERAGATPATLCGALARMGYALHDLNGRPVQASDALLENNLVGVRPGATVRW